jgi:ABC-type branched-subunit amino acid transport system ATPase component
MSSNILELNNVHVAYLQKEVLRGVSFSIRVGELVTLVGENGSGKSTILKVIAGLLRPSEGTVNYWGRNLDGLDVEDRQRLGVGYFMQGGHVFPNLTVQENFNLAAARMRGDKHKPSNLGDWFPILRDRGRDRAGLLSGGQRQMLAIELILAQKPKMLLLDEPTSALSGELATQMLEAVVSYVRDHDAATLLVEHAPAAVSYSTRLLHLINGALDNRDYILKRRWCMNSCG